MKLAPKSIDARWELATAEIALGRDEAAIATLERAMGLADAPPKIKARLDEVLLRRAAELEKKADPSGALVCYQRARELAPEDPARPLAVARCFHALGRSQEALDALRQNLKVHAEHGSSWLLLGGRRQRRGTRRRRRRVPKGFDSQVTAPERLDALRGLGFACAEQDQAEEAIRALSKASELAPEDAGVKAKLADLFEAAGRRDEAISALVDLRGMRGLGPEEQRRLGLLCAARNKHEEAVPAFTAALAKWPGDAGLLDPLATSLEALGRDQDATRILMRLRDAAPSHPNASSRLGFAYQRLGHIAEAAAAFEVARAKEAPRVEVLTALVAAYTTLADEKALRSALEALGEAVAERFRRAPGARSFVRFGGPAD